MNQYDNFSPTDFRYRVPELEPYLSEAANLKYQILVEEALIKVLAKYKIVPQSAVKEFKGIAEKISAEELYREKDRVKHSIRALVNLIKKRTKIAKPYIHFGATSADIIDTADSLRYRDALRKVILPDLLKLEKQLIILSEREKSTLQIGRTHGQHAVPITFGFVLAQYVDRFGERISKIEEVTVNLPGMFSGAVGAYNANSLFFQNPEQFEVDLLNILDLKPARISTQIIPPEPVTDLAHAIISTFGVLANLADDMRHLQRTEIAEVREPFGKDQVGSSTMPQKQNPEVWESIKSVWKAISPRMITVYSDQISEHQRDLTNSASERYFPEILVAFDHSAKRALNNLKNLVVNREKMRQNYQMSSDLIIAEPLQILLSYYKHPNAHEKVRQLAMESIAKHQSLTELVTNDPELKNYLKKFTSSQRAVILKPEKYTGIALKKTQKVCNYWRRKFNL
jgi:adenylosuccinate lyase